MECVFCKIRDGVIKKEFVYEDEVIMVFPDISPVKPIHLLVVPKTHVAEFSKLEDLSLLQKTASVLQKMIKDQGLDTKGYRIGVNGGGAQAVDHLHFHLLGPYKKGARM